MRVSLARADCCASSPSPCSNSHAKHKMWRHLPRMRSIQRRERLHRHGEACRNNVQLCAAFVLLCAGKVCYPELERCVGAGSAGVQPPCKPKARQAGPRYRCSSATFLAFVGSLASRPQVSSFFFSSSSSSAPAGPPRYCTPSGPQSHSAPLLVLLVLYHGKGVWCMVPPEQ